MTGLEVKAWRESRGMSQAQLAERLPMAVRTLQAWEQGRGAPPPFMDRVLSDLEREMMANSRGRTVAVNSLPPGAVCDEEAERRLNEQYSAVHDASKSVRAEYGDGTPIDLRLDERIDAPFPPFPDPATINMAVPYSHGNFEVIAEALHDHFEDQSTHELRYAPVADDESA